MMRAVMRSLSSFACASACAAFRPAVLPQADGPLPLARGGGVGGAAAVFEDAGHVVAVQDAELGFEAQHRAVLAHHAHAQGVEGADQHLFRAAADQPLGALAHLGGGLVGEGDGGDALRVHPGLDQPRDLVRDHPRLARTRPGQHQAGAVHEVHRFLLGKIETGGRRHAHGGLAGRWIPGREVDAIAAVALSAEASTGFSESMLLQG
jgi:hypothetical protein